MNNIYAQPQQSNTYLCDHLATFTSPDKTQLTAHEGIEKLKRLEQTTGVWTLRVRLIITPSSIDVTDVNTAQLIESFPLNSVKDLEVFTPTPSNDVIVFSISDQQLHELHLFQMDEKVKGKNFIADFENMKKSPNNIKRTKANPIYALLPDEAALPVVDNSNKFNREKFPKMMGSVMDETLNDSVERQVKLLDYLFSDIETFVSHLHQIAQAFENKMKRQTIRMSGLGDGLLSLRCKPPPAKDFIDILQKFKLSFILIAKLKQIICKPNAPELVHFLFKPLMLVVSACSDPREEYPELVRKVENPLITIEVRNLFENCLDTPETEMWRKLGPAWNSTSEQWPEELPTYTPIFLNGWQPPLSWMKEILNVGNTQTQQRQPSPRPEQTQDQYLKELQSKGARIYVVKQSREAANPKELTVSKAEYVELCQAVNEKNWWKIRNSKYQTGFAPKAILEPL